MLTIETTILFPDFSHVLGKVRQNKIMQNIVLTSQLPVQSSYLRPQPFFFSFS